MVRKELVIGYVPIAKRESAYICHRQANACVRLLQAALASSFYHPAPPSPGHPRALRTQSLLPVLLLLLALAIPTVRLRGTLPTITYLQVDATQAVSEITLYTYAAAPEAGWRIADYREDRGNWTLRSENIPGTLAVDRFSLCLQTTFTHLPRSEWVAATRTLDIPVETLPIFQFAANASKDAVFHIRLEGTRRDGTSTPIWWETSPLDDLAGTGTWRTYAIDLRGFAQEAGIQDAERITKIDIILDRRRPQTDPDPDYACFTDLTFTASRLVPSNLDRKEAYEGITTPFQAAVLRLKTNLQIEPPWRLQWAAISYELIADTGNLEYRWLLSENRNAAVSAMEGPIFKGHPSRFTDIYRIDSTTTDDRASRSASRTFVNTALGDNALALYPTAFNSGAFTYFELKAIELVYSKVPAVPPSTEAAAQLPGLVAFYVTLGLALPTALLISTLRGKAVEQ